MKSFPLTIASPDQLHYRGEAESLLVRTADGDVEILAGHTDLLAAIGKGGRVRLRVQGKDRLATCTGGVLSVGRKGVHLACTSFSFLKEEGKGDDLHIPR